LLLLNSILNSKVTIKKFTYSGSANNSPVLFPAQDWTRYQAIKNDAFRGHTIGENLFVSISGVCLYTDRSSGYGWLYEVLQSNNIVEFKYAWAGYPQSITFYVIS